MRWTLLLPFLFLISCSGNSQSVEKTLATQQQFDAWSSRPLYQKYGQVSSLKVVYDTQTNKLHFVSSESFEYHYEFCMQVLHFPDDLQKFNDENYSGEPNRRFLLANINYYQALNKFALELGPSDRMNRKHIELLYDAVRKEVFFADRFYLMLNTAHVNNVMEGVKGIPIITPSEIYKGQKYQPISKYQSDGKLRFITNWETQRDSIQPTDILVIDDIPAVFPLVRGVIVTQFQTPLSHVTLLGQNRRIPICAHTDVFSMASVKKMDGQIVNFKVEQDTFLLVLSDAKLEDLWQGGKRVKLSISTSIDSLIPVHLLNDKLSHVVGCKAANFGELHRYSRQLAFKVPESAFAIPFYFYDQHVHQLGISTKIEALLAKDNRTRSSAEIRADLEEIQELILKAPVDARLLRDVDQMIISLGPYRRMRFRSSTNAEDREGFSGAGIYTSKTGEVGSEKKPIHEAIREVWASLWSYNAFMEREAFNMDHSTVAMGILVHRSFPNEDVNGVAITSNLYRDDYLGFVVNAQLGDESVVQPNKSIRCDEFICYPDETASIYGNSESGIDIINYSSLNNGKLVMTEDEIQHLANVLEMIKRRYLRNHYSRESYFNFALDIEFKLDEETRELYIKQMRIYNR